MKFKYSSINNMSAIKSSSGYQRLSVILWATTVKSYSTTTNVNCIERYFGPTYDKNGN